MKLENFFRDEDGFTTVSLVLAILISLSLIFTGAQVYRINSAAAEVQDIADAAALSAENQVGEFMIVAQLCDAVVLSMSLTGLTVIGLGVAALCVPPTASLSSGLLKVGGEILQARDQFANRAAEVLNKLQKALPYYAAACAAGVAAANNADSEGALYLGAAVLVASEGKPIAIALSDEEKQLLDDINSNADEIRKKAQEAEEAAKEANSAKEEAFRRDCGDNPNYCMYERASHLAGLTGTENPLYSSIDTWSFNVALERAKAYYRKRLNSEMPTGNSVEEKARSALRRNFYRYAVETMNSAYVHETNDTFEAYFPHLPHNTEEMRGTSLYTNPIYPISSSDSEKLVMHAWVGCPKAENVFSFGSISQMESEEFETCEDCGFVASSLGKVAAASTSISNGFEYHYEAVATEADKYQKAFQRASVPKAEVKEKAGGLLDRLGDLIKSAFGKRIDPTPPGRYGAIAFVVNVGSTSASGGFGESFVSNGGSLGPRAAISAATLVSENSDEGKTVINSLLDNLSRDGSVVTGAASLALDAWSFLLSAYTNGHDGLASGIKGFLDSMPLAGASGLGNWASKKFTSTVEKLGLQPTELKARKAILVNTGYIAAKDKTSFGSTFIEVKQRVISAAIGSTDLFSMVLSDAESQAIKKIEAVGDSIEIASIKLLGDDGSSIPLTIPIPQAVKNYGVSVVQEIFTRLRSLHGEIGGLRVWE